MSIYIEPRGVSDLKERYFYRTMDLPGIGKIEGEWDLRPNLKKYLGGLDFTVRRVLDGGCASGILGFYMEQQGAELYTVVGTRTRRKAVDIDFADLHY